MADKHGDLLLLLLDLSKAVDQISTTGLVHALQHLAVFPAIVDMVQGLTGHESSWSDAALPLHPLVRNLLVLHKGALFRHACLLS